MNFCERSLRWGWKSSWETKILNCHNSTACIHCFPYNASAVGQHIFMFFSYSWCIFYYNPLVEVIHSFIWQFIIYVPIILHTEQRYGSKHSWFQSIFFRLRHLLRHFSSKLFLLWMFVQIFFVPFLLLCYSKLCRIHVLFVLNHDVKKNFLK